MLVESGQVSCERLCWVGLVVPAELQCPNNRWLDLAQHMLCSGLEGLGRMKSKGVSERHLSVDLQHRQLILRWLVAGHDLCCT